MKSIISSRYWLQIWSLPSRFCQDSLVPFEFCQNSGCKVGPCQGVNSKEMSVEDFLRKSGFSDLVKCFQGKYLRVIHFLSVV